jgi:hypothetical protein
MTNLDEEIRRELRTVPTKANGQGAEDQPARYDFVNLAQQVAAAMVQAAEEQVTQAQVTLEQTRKDAAELLDKVKSKDRELADMTTRIVGLGQTVLEANRKFHAAVTGEPLAQ